jgi:uncharacterized membrane protein
MACNPAYQSLAGGMERADSRRPFIAQRICWVLLWAAIAAYAVVFIVVALTHYARFASYGFDLGIFDQATWLLSRGINPYLTTRGLHAFGDHFSLILVLLAPLFWVWDDVRMLLIFQTCTLALGALPLYLLARKRLGSGWWALLLAVAYLLYPPLQWLNMFDFHPEALATPMILTAFWLLETRRIPLFFAMMALVLMCKEIMALSVISVGAYAWLAGNRRIGAITVGMGVAGLALALSTMRWFNHGAPSPYYGLYAAYGDSLPSIAFHILTHPLQLLKDLTSDLNMYYLGALLWPVMFLPLAAPEWLLVAAPTLLANMLSARQIMHTAVHHYDAGVIPFVLLATMEAIWQLRTLLPVDRGWNRYLQAGFALVLAGGVAGGTWHGPLLPGNPRRADFRTSAAEAAAALRALAIIPPDASVSALQMIVPHLTHRKRIYMFPNPFQSCWWGNELLGTAGQIGVHKFRVLPLAEIRKRIAASDVEYVVLGRAYLYGSPVPYDDYLYLARALLTDPHYGVVSLDGGLVILRRGAPRDRSSSLVQKALASLRVRSPWRPW